ncbi:MAG: LysO family transporter [Candidatus Cryptobacteroides sp.]
MFKVIGIMLAGILIGWLLRNRKGLEWVSKGTMVTIVLLLFVMGIEIGSNRDVMSNILTLGGDALLISLAATLGSVLAASAVYYFFFRK